MRLPRDFLDEIEIELHAARRSTSRYEARVEALVELELLAQTLELELGRRVGPADLVRSARDPREREYRRALVRTLRSPP